jgi:hypothetical protein
MYSDIRAGDPVSAESRSDETDDSAPTRPNTVETAFKDRFVRLQAEGGPGGWKLVSLIEWKNFRLRITRRLCLHLA